MSWLVTDIDVIQVAVAIGALWLTLYFISEDTLKTELSVLVHRVAEMSEQEKRERINGYDGIRDIEE